MPFRQKLDKILSELPNVVFETDTDGRWIYLNPAWEELTGFPVDRSLGESFLDYILEEDRQRNIALFEPLIQRRKERCRHQIRYRHRTQGHVWVEVQAILSYDADGEVSGTVGTLTNVHQQRILADQLEQRDRLLARVMAISPVGFILLDEQERACYLNPAFKELLGIDEAVFGHDVETVRSMLTDRHRTLSDHGLDSGGDLILENQQTQRIIKLGLVHTPDEPTSPEVDRMFAAIDITDEHQLNIAKSYFISAASHELRTPLASVRGFSELLLNDGGTFSEDEKREMLKAIHKQSQVLTSIVTQLLDLNRIESGQAFQAHLERLDVGRATQQIVAAFNAKELRHAINFKAEPGCEAILDEQMLTRLISNQLSNACKYSPERTTIHVSVHGGAREHRPGVEIEITDRGIGMTPQQIHKAFEQFYRAEHSPNVKGLGLGLYIARELATAMQGEITIESTPGAGTTFTTWFPSPEAGAL